MAALRDVQTLATAGPDPELEGLAGHATEVRVGTRNGLRQQSVVSCDRITTIPVDARGEQIGLRFEDQEPSLTEAMHAALDLDRRLDPSHIRRAMPAPWRAP